MPYRSKKINAPKMGKSNKLLIFNLIRAHPGVSRRTLSQITSLDPSTVTKILFSLLSDGLVKEEGSNASQRPGRRSISLGVVKDAAISINLVFGTQRSFLGLGYLDNSFEIVEEFPTSLQVDEYLETVYKKTQSVLEGLGDKRLAGFIVCLPGMADQKRQVMVNIPHLRWEEVDLKAFFLQKNPQWDLPLFLANEAQLAFSSEISRNSAIKEFTEGLYVFISEGVGGALMIDGQIYTGPSFSAGEVGHMSIDPRGPMCYCMNRGCWEELVSVSYVIKRFEERSSMLPQGHLFDKFQSIIQMSDKNTEARKVLDEMADNLAIGIVNLVNILNPSFVMLGGMGEKLPEAYVRKIEADVKKKALKPAAQGFQVIRGSQDILSACAHGSTLLAMDAFARHTFQ